MPGSNSGTESETRSRLLVLEPYYGGSHRDFLDNLLFRLGLPFKLMTLPPRKWKWRMRLSAPWFAHLLKSENSRGIGAVLCSTFVDVALLKSLLPKELASAPIMVYFHENQFAYPVQVEMERDLHFGLTNLTSALAADRLAFNSRYNLDSFIAGGTELLKKAPDMGFPGEFIAGLKKKSRIIHPGLDFSVIDELVSTRSDGENMAPVVVWNHRWEHDKGPEFFFNTLFALDKKGVDFGLIVLGQEFSRCPGIFARAEKELAAHVIHFGHVRSREEYFRIMARGDVVVSTAVHEFYGMAVIEAVRCGLRPLLPDDLSYPELFEPEFLYERDGFAVALEAALRKGRIGRTVGRQLTDRFSWDAVLPEFNEWITAR